MKETTRVEIWYWIMLIGGGYLISQIGSEIDVLKVIAMGLFFVLLEKTFRKERRTASEIDNY